MFNVLIPVLSGNDSLRITQIALLDAVADLAVSARSCANSHRKLAFTRSEIRRVESEIRQLEIELDVQRFLAAIDLAIDANVEGDEIDVSDYDAETWVN
jgi:hypothetical protein